MNRQGHFSDLDGMRGILAVVVMLFHYGLNGLIGNATGGMITESEWSLCVDFFFVLSGFVIALSFTRERPNLALYAHKRFRRLLPMFLLTTIWMLALPTSTATTPEIAANLAVIQSLLGLRSINYPAWSVPFEIFIPAVALLSWPILERFSVVLLCACMFLGGVAGILLVSGVDLPWLRSTAGIGGGFALFHVHTRYPVKRPLSAVPLALFGTCLIIMLLSGKIPILAALFVPASIITIWAGSNAETILSSRPLQIIGAWSYGIYLIHIPVLSTFTAILGEHSLKSNITIKALMIVITFIIAGLGHRFFEKPLMWRRKSKLASIKY